MSPERLILTFCKMSGILVDNSSYALELSAATNANIQCSHSHSGFSFNSTQGDGHRCHGDKRCVQKMINIYIGYCTKQVAAIEKVDCGLVLVENCLLMEECDTFPKGGSWSRSVLTLPQYVNCTHSIWSTWTKYASILLHSLLIRLNQMVWYRWIVYIMQSWEHIT